jgi:hypothetical protein
MDHNMLGEVHKPFLELLNFYSGKKPAVDCSRYM